MFLYVVFIDLSRIAANGLSFFLSDAKLMLVFMQN